MCGARAAASTPSAESVPIGGDTLAFAADQNAAAAIEEPRVRVDHRIQSLRSTAPWPTASVTCPASTRSKPAKSQPSRPAGGSSRGPGPAAPGSPSWTSTRPLHPYQGCSAAGSVSRSSDRLAPHLPAEPPPLPVTGFQHVPALWRSTYCRPWPLPRRTAWPGHEACTVERDR